MDINKQTRVNVQSQGANNKSLKMCLGLTIKMFS